MMWLLDGVTSWGDTSDLGILKCNDDSLDPLDGNISETSTVIPEFDSPPINGWENGFILSESADSDGQRSERTFSVDSSVYLADNVENRSDEEHVPFHIAVPPSQRKPRTIPIQSHLLERRRKHQRKFGDEILSASLTIDLQRLPRNDRSRASHFGECDPPGPLSSIFSCSCFSGLTDLVRTHTRTILGRSGLKAGTIVESIKQ